MPTEMYDIAIIAVGYCVSNLLQLVETQVSSTTNTHYTITDAHDCV